jgi:AraC family ethanolamine operon transcriptional activator
MKVPDRHELVNWRLIADRCFEDIEALNDRVQGWEFEFHQLKAGTSPAKLLQIGRPEFFLSSFYFEQSYHQRGCTAPDYLTVGLTQDGTNEVTTPDGVVQRDEILCFPSGRELSAVSRSGFKGYSLSISNALLDEVATSCGLQMAARIGAVQQVLHCHRGSIHALRRELRLVSGSLEKIRATENSSEVVRDLEFNLIRQLLLAITGSQPKHEIKLTSRKRIVLQRARNYIEANADRAITVLELAQAAGSCVRTLEYVFREYFDVTPKAFLKSRRLAAVRRELLRPLNSRFSVTEIANRWGFWHMSQFAADYRRFFGELPSETLRAMN